jgi:hypothetical protein
MVNDVSSLKSVKYLDLSSCSDVEDVSMLGNCQTLILSECKSIKDISALGSVITLDIRGVRIKYGLPYNNTVKNLLFSSEYVDNVSKFERKDNRRVFTLERDITNCSKLDGYRILKINQVEDFSFLVASNLDSLQQMSLTSEKSCGVSLVNLPSLSHLSITGNFSNIHIHGPTLPNLYFYLCRDII